MNRLLAGETRQLDFWAPRCARSGTCRSAGNLPERLAARWHCSAACPGCCPIGSPMWRRCRPARPPRPTCGITSSLAGSRGSFVLSVANCNTCRPPPRSSRRLNKRPGSTTRQSRSCTACVPVWPTRPVWRQSTSRAPHWMRCWPRLRRQGLSAPTSSRSGKSFCSRCAMFDTSLDILRDKLARGSRHGRGHWFGPSGRANR